jgi:hypothetical protein
LEEGGWLPLSPFCRQFRPAPALAAGPPDNDAISTMGACWCCRPWRQARWRWPSPLRSGPWRNNEGPSSCAAPSNPLAREPKPRWANAMRFLGAGREALVVWGRDGSGPFSYGGGEALLDSCLKGPDAHWCCRRRWTDLSDKGARLPAECTGRHGRKLVARGRAVGSMAAVWLEEPSDRGGHHRLPRHPGCLPIPVWLRDKALALIWANHAFLKATGMPPIWMPRGATRWRWTRRARPGRQRPQPEM